MGFEEVKKSRVYEQAETLADAVWELVTWWRPLEQDTIGKQLVRAADSIGANIAEGAGRFYTSDRLRFLYYA